MPVYTIALGTETGSIDLPDEFGVLRPFPVPPDPETLRQIAEETGGRFFEAPSEADLQAVYEEIGSQVATEDEERELTAAFAGAGAAVPHRGRRAVPALVRTDSLRTAVPHTTNAWRQRFTIRYWR